MNKPFLIMSFGKLNFSIHDWLYIPTNDIFLSGQNQNPYN